LAFGALRDSHPTPYLKVKMIQQEQLVQQRQVLQQVLQELQIVRQVLALVFVRAPQAPSAEAASGQ